MYGAKLEEKLWWHEIIMQKEATETLVVRDKAYLNNYIAHAPLDLGNIIILFIPLLIEVCVQHSKELKAQVLIQNK